MNSIATSVALEYSELLLKPRCGSLQIDIVDQGPGIGREEMARLFREGVQFNPNQLQAGQGSGLGLWISKGIIELHLGRLSAHSEGLGKGSTFSIEIPLVEHPRLELEEGVEGDVEMGVFGHENPDLDSTPSAGSIRYTLVENTHPVQEITPKTLSDAADKESAVKEFDDKTPPAIKRILIVDDTATNRKIVRRILKIDGFTDVDEAKDGQECVEMVSCRPPSEPWYDLILMDYEMPRMNGPTATSRLRELGYSMPIIGVTGNILNADVSYFLESGANSVLPKPVVMKDLYEVYGNNRRKSLSSLVHHK
jgi:CheY-like chemotaxis protein